MSTALWQFVKSEAATNLDTNPSAETATTGWTAGSGTLARSTEQQAVGVYSFKYTPAAATTDGMYRSYTLTVSTTYTFAISFYGVLGIPYRIRVRNQSNGVDVGSNLTFTGTGAWVRCVITFTTSSTGTSYRLYVEKNSSASTGAFYVDAVQLEQADHATTYMDGDQEGCAWTGTAHASTSQRAVTTGAGGRVTDLTSTSYLNVEDHTGVGTPPIEIMDSLPGQGDGGDYQASRHRPRFFSLIGTIMGTGADTDAARSSYHQKRRNLIAAFVPHRLPTDQPVKIRYKWLTRSVELKCFYQNGLEKGAFTNAITEEVSLGFKAEMPFYRRCMGTANGDWGADQGGAALTVRQNVTDADLILRRSADGAWSSLGSGIVGTDVRAIIHHPNGYVYVGGNFTDAGGSGADYFARYDPATNTWAVVVSATAFNGSVLDMALGANGVIYIVGGFTNANGIAAADYIVSYDPSTNTYAALGSGGTAQLNVVKVSPTNGYVYVGGIWSSDIGGVAATNGCGYWDGSGWNAMGTGLQNAFEDVRAIAFLGDDVYYGGGFAGIGGVAGADNLARFNGSAWNVMAGGQPNSVVEDLDTSPGGEIYMVGIFTSIGTQSIQYAARWNKSSYFPLGVSGVLNNAAYRCVFQGDIFHLGGSFTQVGNVPLPDRFARYTGNVFLAQDIDLPGNPTIYAIAPALDGSLYVGFTTTGTAVAAGRTTILSNGDTYTYPKLTIAGPGQVYSLTNYTTGKAIFFDLLLLAGETAVLNLNPEKLSFVSSFRGNLLAQGAILGGSDHDNFYLAPGSNSLSLFINDASASAVLTWDELFYSFDGVV